MGERPEGVVVAYASWSECDAKVLTAARAGANVIVWFAVNLAVATSGSPTISGGPDLGCVSRAKTQLQREGLGVTHMISVGGWNAPHPPDGAADADAWWQAIQSWNRAHGAPFDGLDWDLEGADAPAKGRSVKEANTFSVKCLRLMGAISQRAKSAGWLVSLAPPESYFTPATSEFNRTCLALPIGGWHPEFRFAGRNAYAFLIAAYGQVPGSQMATFDYVFLQLYESWSLTHMLVARGEDVGDVLTKIMHGITTGWRVEFSADPSLGLSSRRVQLKASQVILGLANAWAARNATGPALFINPSALARAYARIPRPLRPGGLGFWTIASEGDMAPNGEGRAVPLEYARELGAIVHAGRQLGPDRSGHRMVAGPAVRTPGRRARVAGAAAPSPRPPLFAREGIPAAPPGPPPERPAMRRRW